MIGVASAALATIRNRVQERGLNPEGGRYRDYTEGYKQMKEKAGKYKGYVDFSFTNRMWTNIKLISPQEELNSCVAVIKASSSEEQEKLNKNTASRGDILKLSEQERKRMAEIYDEGILHIWRRNGL
jgi:ABC-type uncharacterized transport system ATPase subunit